MKREFTGVFIHAHIWLSKELIPAEKMLLGEIEALSKSYGYCDASRAHFAEWLCCTVQNITYYFEKLEKLGFITIEKIPGYRSKIRVVADRFYMNENQNRGKRDLPLPVNGTYPRGKRDLPEIKEEIKERNNKDMSGKPDDHEILPLEEKKKKEKVHPAAALEKKIEALREKYIELSKDKEKNHGELLKLTKQGNALKEQLETEKEIDSVILLLNNEAGFRYELTSKEARRIIGKRLSEDPLEKVFHVVRFKIKEWNGTEWHKYLRPETLLNGHFEGYYQASLLPKSKPTTQPVYEKPKKYLSEIDGIIFHK